MGLTKELLLQDSLLNLPAGSILCANALKPLNGGASAPARWHQLGGTGGKDLPPVRPCST